MWVLDGAIGGGWRGLGVIAMATTHVNLCDTFFRAGAIIEWALWVIVCEILLAMVFHDEDDVLCPPTSIPGDSNSLEVI